MKKKQKNYNLILGSAIALFMLVFLLVGCFYTPYDPDAMNGVAKFAPPQGTHSFGCDHFGRDIFSRVMKGTGTTFLVAIATVALGGGIGIFIGAFTGYFGGWADEVLMRFNDAVFSFPHILLALVFISILGTGQVQCDTGAFCGVYPQFCQDYQRGISGAKGNGLCKKRPAYGGIPSADYVCAYFSQYPACCAFHGSHWL